MTTKFGDGDGKVTVSSGSKVRIRFRKESLKKLLCETEIHVVVPHKLMASFCFS